MAHADSRFENTPLITEEELADAGSSERRGGGGGGVPPKAVAYGVVLLVVGAAGAWFALGDRSGELGSRAYYYDESAERLFVAEAQQYPPIDGIDDSSNRRDGVQAIVYTCGEGGERKIAYLRRYTDEAIGVFQQADRAQLERRDGPPEASDRRYITENTLVRRVDEEEWHAQSSREGQAIIAILHEKCSNGEFPMLVDPSD